MRLILLICLLLSGCNDSVVKINPGENISVDSTGVTSDSRIIDYLYPPGSKNVFYLGDGWITFEFQSQCFLIANHGRSSVLTKIDCVDYIE